MICLILCVLSLPPNDFSNLRIIACASTSEHMGATTYKISNFGESHKKIMCAEWDSVLLLLLFPGEFSRYELPLLRRSLCSSEAVFPLSRVIYSLCWRRDATSSLIMSSLEGFSEFFVCLFVFLKEILKEHTTNRSNTEMMADKKI